MKKNNLVIAFVFATGMMFASCGGAEKAPEQETEATTEMETEAVKEETAEVNTTHEYVCPMHCENSASHEPGQCPVCGMDLVMNENFAGNTEAASTDQTPALSEDESASEAATE